MKNDNLSDPIKYAKYLQPEHELEHLFLQDEAFLLGLRWGKPRFGHPEGQVYKHIQEVLLNVDALGQNDDLRHPLRVISYVHDTFKYLEDKSYPRDWSKHHSVYARKFLEKYTNDEAMLMVTELHDEAFHCWCQIHLYNNADLGEARLKKLLKKLGDHLQLYYLFFKCDTKTGDKNQAPLRWFEENIPNIEIRNF